MTRAAGSASDPRTTRTGDGICRIRGERILYVDDDPSVRFATGRLLRDAGAICILASTHDQAVMLAGGDPALALAILDFQMPDGDVGGLVERLRAARAALPLIGTSGADRRSEFAARGVTRFLEKPWQLGDLVRAVEASHPPIRHVAHPGAMESRGFPARLVW